MIPVEQHPLRPFLPEGARLLMLGGFPPPRHRWAMDFFYPNRSNMMWTIFGLVFYGDSQRLVDVPNKTFRLEDIKALLEERGIAIYDTASAVRRLRGNASDKDLEIVEKTDIPLLLSQIPLCNDIVCTGQKSFSVLTEDYGVPVPQMGRFNEFTIDSPLSRGGAQYTSSVPPFLRGGAQYTSSVPPLLRGGAQRAEGCIEKRSLRLWRMPSSSRAYPMKLEDKAAYYREMMQHIGLITP